MLAIKDSRNLDEFSFQRVSSYGIYNTFQKIVRSNFFGSHNENLRGSFPKGFMYRPLSPHLFIYKAQLSSIFSVLHRTTGMFLALGLLFFVFSMELFAYNLSFYSIYSLAFFLDAFSPWFIISCFLILLFSFLYHLSNGIRHLIWDFIPQKYLNNTSIRFSAFFLLVVVFLGFFGILTQFFL